MARIKARRASSNAFPISVLTEPGQHAQPLYAQLYRQIRDHILSERLAPGALLPSARTLANDLHVSRNTVEAAIARLCSDGFVTRHVGAGTVVANLRDVVPFHRAGRGLANASVRTSASIAHGKREQVSAQPEAGAWQALSDRGRQLSQGGRIEIESDERHALCMTDVSRFPSRTWDRLQARIVRQRSGELLRSGTLQGDAALRNAIVDHVRLARGLRCTAAQVIILNSTQQALDVSARLLLNEGDAVLVEEPGYRSARATFSAAGARVRGIPVDHEGLQPEWLSQHSQAKLLYVTPSHHFPLGVTLTLPRRMATLEWARANSRWIIEDDYDSEFQYDGRPIAAMQGLDHAARVIYVGTFNKVLFPGIRVAYAVVPPALVSAFVHARRLLDGGPPTLVQAVLAEFLSGGHYAAHLRRSRTYYHSQRNLLVSTLRSLCGNAVTLGPSDTGLHLVAHLAQGADDERIALIGAANGLGVAPLSHYYAEAPDSGRAPHGLLFSFGGASEASIVSCVRAIAKALNR